MRFYETIDDSTGEQNETLYGWVSMNEWIGMMNTRVYLECWMDIAGKGWIEIAYSQTLYIDWEFSSETGWKICIYGGVCCCFSRLHSDDEFVLFLLDCCLLREGVEIDRHRDRRIWKVG